MIPKTYWRIWPEVPDDDGKATENFFATEHEVIGVLGDEETLELSGEPIGEPVFLDGVNKAKGFLKQVGGNGFIEYKI